LCFKVLVQRKGKRDEIISRSVCVPRDPNSNIPPNLTANLVKCQFPKKIPEKKPKLPAKLQADIISVGTEREEREDKQPDACHASTGILEDMAEHQSGGFSDASLQDPSQTVSDEEGNEDSQPDKRPKLNEGMPPTNSHIRFQDDDSDSDDETVDEKVPNPNPLHTPEISAMLDASDEIADQYLIEKHFWSKRGLMLKVTDRFLGNTFVIDATDAKVDCPHQLATFIRGKNLRGKDSSIWKKWVDEHFCRINRIFRRLEVSFGMESYLANQATVGTLSEVPHSDPPAANTRFRRVSAKRAKSKLKKPSGVNRRKSKAVDVVQYGVKVPKNVPQALE
jgi:hypothetical protein